MQQIENKMLTSTEAAMRLNVHINTLRRWTNIGVLKSYRIGIRGDRRIKTDDIESFVEKSYLK